MKQQIEVTFDRPEPFALKIESTQDGDRAIQEQAQREADRELASQKQPALI